MRSKSESAWFHHALGSQVWKKNAGEGYADRMSEETWTAEELFEGMTRQAGFIAELGKHGLIRAVARDVRGGALYSAEARDELEKVLALVELGYKLEDIAAIAKDSGLAIEYMTTWHFGTTYYIVGRPGEGAAGAPMAVATSPESPKRAAHHPCTCCHRR